jgi:hypothetical protein
MPPASFAIVVIFVPTNLRFTVGANVFTARIKGNAAEVGARAAVEADHVIAAIGYKVDMRRLQFISDQSR